MNSELLYVIDEGMRELPNDLVAQIRLVVTTPNLVVSVNTRWIGEYYAWSPLAKKNRLRNAASDVDFPLTINRVANQIRGSNLKPVDSSLCS